MFDAFFERNREEGERHFKRLQQIVDDPVERKRDQVRRLTALCMSGLDEEALNALRDFVPDSEVESFALRMQGLCLNQSGQAGQAASTFDKAAKAASTPTDLVPAIVFRAEALIAIGESQQAQQELEAALREDHEPIYQEELWKALAETCVKTNQKLMRAVALHKLAELAANNPGKWFDAGYAYSDTDVEALDPLAVHCYRAALRFDPERHWAINNLGAVLSNMNLFLLAVDYYELAAEKENPLAAANMAEKQLNAGFSKGATELLERARKFEQSHKKVESVSAKLREKRESQNEEFAQVKEQGERAASFFSKFGQARLEQYEAASLSGDWKIEADTKGQVKIAGNSIEVVWSAAGKGSHRRFVGVLAGATAVGSFEKQATWPSSDDPIHWESDGAGYMLFAEKDNAFTMVKALGHSPKFIQAEQVSEDN